MTRSLRDALNESNPNKLAAGGKTVGMGNALSRGLMFKAGAVGTVTTHVMSLSNTEKCRTIIAAYSRVGTLTGALTPIQGPGPVTTEVGVTDDGDIVFATADAVTDAEVSYLTHEGVVVTKTLAVASDLAQLPAGSRAAVLISASSLAGTLTGTLTVEARGDTPTTGEAAITDTGETIEFAAADAVTSCQVTYVQQPDSGGDVGVNTALEAQGGL